MKASTGAAVALAVGYVLGRRRKLRAAAILTAATASGRSGSLLEAAVKRGMGFAGSSSMLGKLTPQFGGISSTVRDELLKAGRAVAVGVVNNRIDSLSDSLHQRAESMRGVRAGTGGGDSEQDDDDADYYEEDEPKDAYEDENDVEPQGRYDDDGEPTDTYDEDEFCPAQGRLCRCAGVLRRRRAREARACTL